MTSIYACLSLNLVYFYFLCYHLWWSCQYWHTYYVCWNTVHNGWFLRPRDRNYICEVEWWRRVYPLNATAAGPSADLISESRIDNGPIFLNPNTSVIRSAAVWHRRARSRPGPAGLDAVSVVVWWVTPSSVGRSRAHSTSLIIETRFDPRRPWNRPRPTRISRS